ncbi:MAG: hypothetical protein IPK03_01650 [Bacteroidetes bacterium]|nr:hypothetical protein [Bacteroidota bacterium]
MKKIAHFFHRLKLKSLLMLCLGILIYSCKKSEKYCDVIDPIEELNWLKGKINIDSSVNIMQMTYNSVEGFYIGNADDSIVIVANSYSEYWTCDGKLLYRQEGSKNSTIPFPNGFWNNVQFKKIYPKSI